jgi:hypothetical protein
MCPECLALQNKVTDASQRLTKALEAEQGGSKHADFDNVLARKEVASIRQECRVALFKLKEHMRSAGH